MPLELARRLIKETFQFQALELENSLLLSAVDQHYHSRDFQHSGQSLLEGLADVTGRYGFFPFDGVARYSRCGRGENLEECCFSILALT